MACDAKEREVVPDDVCEERPHPTLKCCASAVVREEITKIAVAVTKGTGTKFLCRVPGPALGSGRLLLGDHRLFCAVSEPDQFADFW